MNFYNGYIKASTEAYDKLIEKGYKPYDEKTKLCKYKYFAVDNSKDVLEFQGTSKKGTQEFYLVNDNLTWDEPFTVTDVTDSKNNGGSTDYYKFDPLWKECADVIEGRTMNYNQGNVFKAAFCFNTNRHDGTNYERELNKIIYFAQRELDRLKEIK